jgi:hypothetical protein
MRFMSTQIEYLYGDSTPSPLKTDFIAFLRDALDFAVEVLLRDGLASDAIQRAAQLAEVTEKQIENAETLAADVSHALDQAATGDRDPLTARCAARIRQGVKDLVRAEADAARAAVATEKARASQAAASALGACARAFEALVLRRELPEAVTVTKLRVEGAATYDGRLHAQAPYGLKWVVGLEIPSSHPLARVLRIERIIERLDVEVPEEAGWIHKHVKNRPQRLDRLHLTELVVGPTTTTVSLRAAPDGTGAGFDVTFSPDTSRVELVRILEGGATDSPYEVVDDDVAKLQPLRDALVTMARELSDHKRSLIAASLDDTPLHQLQTPRVLVERLIANIAPTVEQVSRRSLAPGELVLRRLLDGNHREEVFVSKAELVKKLAMLPIEQRIVFEPLKLWDPLDLHPLLAQEHATPKADRPPAAVPAPVDDRIEAPQHTTAPMATAQPLVLGNNGTDILAESTGKWPLPLRSPESEASIRKSP